AEQDRSTKRVTPSRDAPNAPPPDATLLGPSVRRARYVPAGTDTAPVAALLTALYDGFLTAVTGPDTWQRTTVLIRLVQSIRAEEWTVAELLGRYHLTPRELADELAALAWEWYCRRPLEDDADWPASKRRLPARRVRAILPHVHAVREVLRDLAPQVAWHFDARVKASLGWATAEQAHEMAVRETV